MRRSKIVLSLFVSLMAITLVGCPQQRRIGEITADPAAYYHKEVAVVGRVSQSFGALGQGIYELEDESGRIWVFTEKYGVPSRGARVGVTGRITSGVTFAGRNYATVLHETRRRTHPGN